MRVLQIIVIRLGLERNLPPTSQVAELLANANQKFSNESGDFVLFNSFRILSTSRLVKLVKAACVVETVCLDSG